MHNPSFNSMDEDEREEIVERTVEKFLPAPSIAGKKIVVTGKGGVGKTAISAALCHVFARNGSRVLAVDGDPQMNLGPTLGLSPDIATKIVPLNAQFDYIEEKVGARPESGWGMFLTLNPNVDDVVSRFGIKVADSLELLVMGTLSKASIGCLCPENTLLAATVNHIALRSDEMILMDTEAGVEHFGRAIARGFDDAVVVTDPSYNSLTVAVSALKLARNLGISGLHLICNKIRSNRDVEKVNEFISAANLGFDFTKFSVPYDVQVYENDPSILPVLDSANSQFYASIRKISDGLARTILTA
jgi:CO dehydrogenase maturation factor